MGKYLDSIGLGHLMSLIKTALGLKQDALVSGTNIKTINNESLLGSGNISVGGGSSAVTGVKGDSESTYRTGNVNLTAANVGAASAANVHHSTSEMGLVTDNGLSRFIVTGNRNPRIDTRESTADSFATLGYLPLMDPSAAPNASSMKAANKVFATPNGSSGFPTMRKLVAADIDENLVTADKGSTSYYGLVNPDGASSGWMRTTVPGLLPAAEGGGSSSLGTSYWPFQNIYGENFYINGHKVGDTAKGAGQSAIDSSISSVSTTSGTTKNLDSIVLAPGTWLVSYSVEFASNASGRRAMTLTTNNTSITSTPVYMVSGAPANGMATNLSRTQVIVNSGTTNITRYLNAYQNSGSSLNCRSCIQAVRIA